MNNNNQNQAIELDNWSYCVEMGCGIDTWRLSGEVYGHPELPDGRFAYVSTPKEYDAQKRLVRTASGRTYRLANCKGDETKQIGNIVDDIKRGGTSVW